MKYIDILFPPACPICFGHVGSAVVCESCEDKLKASENIRQKYVSVDGKSVRVRYLYRYGKSELTRYIFALKKRANTELFSHAAHKLLPMLSDIPFTENTVITNVPRRKVNVRIFGYDHSERIAKFIAKQSHGKLRYEKLVKRCGFSKDQKDLDAAARQINARGKYKAENRQNVRSIILFDDVITTSSSFSECVRQLRHVYGNDIEITGLFLAARNADNN